MKILKRTAALMVVLLLLAVCILPFDSSAATDREFLGYWTQTDVRIFTVTRPMDLKIDDHDYSQEYPEPVSFSVTDHSIQITELQYTGYYLEAGKNKSYPLFDWSNIEVEWTNPPTRFDYYSDGSFVMDPSEYEMKYSVSSQNVYFKEWQGDYTAMKSDRQGYIGVAFNLYEPYPRAVNEDFDFDSLSSDKKSIEEFFGDTSSYWDGVYCNYHNYVYDMTVNPSEDIGKATEYETGTKTVDSYSFGDDEEILDILYIPIRTYYVDCYIAFIYEYHEGVTSAESEPGYIIQDESSNADNTPGEDKGTNINPGILGGDDDGSGILVALGIVSALAGGAAVAVGAGVTAAIIKSGGKKKRDKDKDKHNTTYKMYVYKDFGDSIVKGAKQVRVCARIAKVENGRESDDFGLTSSIRVSVRDLTLHSSAMNGHYMTATVSAPGDKPNTPPDQIQDKATVSFTVNSPKGVFTRNVVFRLIGKPAVFLVYVKPSGELARKLDLTELARANMSKNAKHMMFFGDDLDGVVYLAVQGYSPRPTVKVSSGGLGELAPQAAPVDSISPQCDAVLKGCYFYRAVLNNRTKAPDDSKGYVIRDCVDVPVTVTASGNNAPAVEGKFIVSLIPRGFFLDLRYADKNQLSMDHIELHTDILDEQRNELKQTLLPIGYGCLQTDKFMGYDRITNITPYFNKKMEDFFIGETQMARNIRNEFKMYFHEESGSPYKVFQPKLPVLMDEETDSLFYKLALCADYNADGVTKTAKGYFSVCLYGFSDKAARDKLAARAVALNTFFDLIDLYGFRDNDGVRQHIANIRIRSTDEIITINKWMFEFGVKLQEEEFSDAQKTAALMSFGIFMAESTKWVCDISFTIVLRMAAAEMGFSPDLAEAIVVPLKEFIEEFLVDYFNGKNGFINELFKSDRIVDKFEKMAQNYMFNKLTDTPKFGVDLGSDLAKKAGLIVLAAGVNLTKHIYLESKRYSEAAANGTPIQEPIIYAIMRKFVSDMSVQTLKLVLTKLMISKSSSNMNKILFDPKRGLNQKLENLQPGTAAYQKMYTTILKARGELASRVLSDVNYTVMVPELAKTGIDAAGKKISEWAQVVDNAVNAFEYKAYDQLTSATEAIGESRYDENLELVVITAEHGVFRIPTLSAVLLYIDDWIEKSGINDSFRCLDDSPIHLDPFPIQGCQETISDLESVGLNKQAQELKTRWERR